MKKHLYTNFQKPAVFILAASLLTGGIAWAQDTPANVASSATANPGAHGGAKHDQVSDRLQRMSKRLNLTDDQKSKISPILQDELKRARSIRRDSSLSEDQKRAQLVELHQTSQGLIQGLLTPEQAATMNAPGAAGSLAWMSKSLNLTDEQKSKLQPLLDDQQKQVQAVKQDSSIPPQQKEAKIRAIRQATHGQVMSILTPEQQQKMRATSGKGARRHPGYGQGMGPDVQPAPPSPPQ